jgi:hypothetical protein
MAIVDWALCDVDDVITYAEITGDTGPSVDSVLEWLINAVTERFEHGCGRQFLARSKSIRMHGPGGRVLLLPEFPVVEVTGLASLYDDGTVYQQYSVDPADLYVAPSGRCVLQGVNNRLFPTGKDNILVDYAPGWLAVPADVKLAAIQWVTDWFKAWRNKRDPIESISFAGVNAFIRSEPVPKKVQPVIDAYRFHATAAA